MKLYVTRHGETEFNVLHKISGTTDVELTDKGKEQAAKLAELLADKNIDLIISSPMKRAQDTARAIAQKCNVDILIDERLKEQDYGIYEGMDPKTSEFQSDRRHFALRCPQGESKLQLAARAYALLDDIKDKYSDKTVLLVCHGGTCRVIHTYFHDMTNEEFFGFKMDNCGIQEYDLSAKDW